MTPERIKKLVAEYAEDIFEGCSPEQYNLAERAKIKDGMDGVESHLLWMCQNFPDAPEEKLNRWLGFLQGAIWALGYRSIDQLREDCKHV